jgi:hypothetical protein
MQQYTAVRAAWISTRLVARLEALGHQVQLTKKDLSDA